jgi:hypothetical protein
MVLHIKVQSVAQAVAQVEIKLPAVVLLQVVLVQLDKAIVEVLAQV